MKTVKIISVHQKNRSESYWRGDELYDSKREKENIVKIFGITIYHKADDFVTDVVDDNKKPLGFKK